MFQLFRFRFDVRGSEHVPTTGGAIISSNHVSFFDFTFLGLGALPQHRLVRFMAKAAVFDHWLAGPAMRAMKHIPVDRKAGTAAFESAVRALKDGEVVGIFPEATISTSFTVKDIKAGVARMAVESGVPIIPAAVWGGQRIATKGHKVVFRRGVPVTVILGEPIVAEPGEKVQPLLRRTKAAMEALLDEAQRTYPDAPPARTTVGGSRRIWVAPRRRPRWPPPRTRSAQPARSRRRRSRRWPPGRRALVRRR